MRASTCSMPSKRPMGMLNWRRMRAAGRVRGKRYAAAHGQLFHQHAPTLPCHREAADEGVEGHEHVLPLDGAVLKGNVERKMPPADADSWGIPRDQCAGDAEV